MKKFESLCLKFVTVAERNIQEMIRSVELFLSIVAKFKCGRIIY